MSTASSTKGVSSPPQKENRADHPNMLEASDDLLTQCPDYEEEEDKALVVVENHTLPNQVHEPSHWGSATANDSDDDSESSPEMGLSLMEIRAHNLRRNQAVLEELGLARGLFVNDTMAKARMARKRKAASAKSDQQSHVDEDIKPRGVLLDVESWSPLSSKTAAAAAAAATATSNVEHSTPFQQQQHLLFQRFPHREMQLRKLLGLLGHSVSHASSQTGVSILVAGPHGTGKTCLVRHVVQLLARQHNVTTAYLNCDSLDVTSLVGLTRSAFKQLVDDIAASHGTKETTTHRKRSRMDERGSKITTVQGNSQLSRDVSQQGSKNRAVLSRATSNNAAGHAVTGKTLEADVHNAIGEERDTTTAVSVFGRDVQELLQKHKYAGVLILENIEKLQNLSNYPRNNMHLITQIMSLPRLFGMNLNVIGTATSAIIERHPSMVSVLPYTIHFPCYRGKDVLKSIFTLDHIKVLVLGIGSDTETSTAFKQSAYESFIDTLLQSVHGSTTDVRELIQLARRLWPKYIEPMGAAHIDRTISAATKSLESISTTPDSPSYMVAFEREIRLSLDRKFLSSMRNDRLLECGPFREQPPPGGLHVVPRLAKLMLLAGYLCQVNKADKDKHLFSIQKNGRRRRNDTVRDDQEDGAFGVGAAGVTAKLARPKTFPMERMISVYVSLVGLTASEKGSEVDARLKSLGGTAFYELLSHLLDMGLLHEYPARGKDETIRLTETRLWCSLDDREARELSATLGLNLDQYIV